MIIVRSRIAAIALVFVAWIGASPGSAFACERLLRADDVIVEIRGNDITAVIVNTTDKCALVYADNLRAAPGRELEIPNPRGIRVETLDGKVLSPDWPGSGWYSPSDEIIDFSLIRQPPGEVRIKRWEVYQMLWRIDAYRKAEGNGPLPWGSTVVVRMRLTLFTDVEAAAGRFHGDPEYVGIETSPILYVLPQDP